MKNVPWALIAKIAIALLAILAAGLFLPRTESVQSTGYTRSDQKIVIIPTSGIPLAFLEELRGRLERQHGVGVLVATEMGMLPDGELATGQYSAHSLAGRGLEVLKSLRRDGAYCIVLTNRDIN